VIRGRQRESPDVCAAAAFQHVGVNVLVTAASRHGSTLEIAEAIAGGLRMRGLDATVDVPAAVDSIDEYDAVVIGSAVYLGHWLEPALKFVNRFPAELAARPVWLFSSGPVGDPSRGLVQKMNVDPAELPELRETTGAKEHRMFPGKLDKKNLSWSQRAGLAVVRGLDGDFRDWDEIERWAASIADGVRARAAAERIA
jgi:menaquinone-dependent protoporphyrinogen oxidase